MKSRRFKMLQHMGQSRSKVVGVAVLRVLRSTRRVCYLLLLIPVLTACPPRLPGPSHWTRTHDLYPDTTVEQAVTACRNQWGKVYSRSGTSETVELYIACMEAFGFALKDSTAS